MNNDKNPQEAGKEPKWPAASPEIPSKNSNEKTNQAKDKSYFQKESVEDKVRDSLRNFKGGKKIENVYGYAKENKEQSISYVLLIVGFLLLLFTYHWILGELLIGLAAGYHFAPQIMGYLKSFSGRFSGNEAFHSIVILALIVAVFITAPGLVVGALAAAGLKEAFYKFK